MAKRLYLHIGYPKTGTTMLQACFAANAGALAKLGFLYPQTGQIHDAHYAMNFALGIGEFDKSLNIPSSGALRAALNEEIAQSDCDSVIISSEYFSVAQKPELVKDFFSDYDATIVVYLRRHDHALEDSAYAQAVKTVRAPPWGPSLESFALHQLALLNFHYDYFANIVAWAKCFGKSGIIVRPYERDQNKPDLVTDFLTTIGAAKQQADALARPGQVNRSLGSDALAAILAVRSTSLPENVKQFIVGRIVQLCQRSNSPGPLMPTGTTRALMTRYGGGYARIAREYLGRDDGVLFRETIPEVTGSKGCTAASPDSTLDLILRALSGALREV